MLDTVNRKEVLVGARLLDFFAKSTPWHRRLWNPGLVLTLREVLEASKAVNDSVLHQGALESLTSSCLRLSGQDGGVGGAARLQTLHTSLRSKLVFDDLEYHKISSLADQVGASYLSNWADELASGVEFGTERIARSIATHLLDLGFSPNYLHRWWKFRIEHETGSRKLAEILADAHELSQRGPQNYRVLVIFTSAPATRSGYPADWLDSAAVSKWLKANSSDVSEIRPAGGVAVTVSAQDPEGASHLATELADNLVARVSVGTGDEVRLENRIWVEGTPVPFPMARYVRGVRVKALYREDRVLNYDQPTGIIDAAIELLSHLESSSPSAAAAGGWAAIEALLSPSKDRGSAATRFAALVACSFPRAELTALSYALESSVPDNAALLSRLSGKSDNRERCSIVANSIESGEILRFRTLSDEAARNRIKTVVKTPKDALAAVRFHVADAFRRLYRQRNLVLHGGKTDAVALRASLRTAAPLVGAGMDRIAHGWYVEGLRPIELAARAEIALETVSSGDIETCLSLLATPRNPC